MKKLSIDDDGDDDVMTVMMILMMMTMTEMMMVKKMMMAMTTTLLFRSLSATIECKLMNQQYHNTTRKSTDTRKFYSGL